MNKLHFERGNVRNQDSQHVTRMLRVIYRYRVIEKLGVFPFHAQRERGKRRYLAKRISEGACL